MIKMNETQNIIKAVMLGHAVGDALGVPVEFESRDELDKNPVADMVGYGTHPVPAGAWSDDTSMSLAALDSLSKGKVDYFEIMFNFMKWLKDGKYTPTGKSFDVGRTCLRAMLKFNGICYSKAEGFILPPSFDVTKCGQNSENDNGNGSLMRIHPFALMTCLDERLKHDFEVIMDQASALTHAHERSKLACKIYAIILNALIEQPDKETIPCALKIAKRRYLDNPEYGHYARLFDEGFANLNQDEIRSSGYVVDSLEAAVWCLLTTDSYKECVLKAVNLGDDTDTVAAIAGGLAGALYGLDGIPQEWLDILIKREYIEEMCDRASAAWAPSPSET